MILTDTEKQYLQHEDLELHKLANYNILGNNPENKWNASLMRESIAILRSATEECIWSSYDRKKKNDAVIIVDQYYTNIPILSLILANYYSNWEVYSITTIYGKTSESEISYVNFPKNLHLLNSLDIKSFYSKNKSIFIDNHLLYFSASSLRKEYLEKLRQPKHCNCDVFTPNHNYREASGLLTIHEIENYGDCYQLDIASDDSTMRNYLTIYTDIILPFIE